MSIRRGESGPVDRQPGRRQPIGLRDPRGIARLPAGAFQDENERAGKDSAVKRPHKGIVCFISVLNHPSPPFLGRGNQEKQRTRRVFRWSCLWESMSHRHAVNVLQLPFGGVRGGWELLTDVIKMVNIVDSVCPSGNGIKRWRGAKERKRCRATALHRVGSLATGSNGRYRRHQTVQSVHIVK